MESELIFGHVYRHSKFQFRDGPIGIKLIVVLGIDQDQYVVSKTTSRQHERNLNSGCQRQGTNYHSWHIKSNELNCFSADTWICFDQFFSFSKTDFDNLLSSGVIKKYNPNSSILNEMPKLIYCALSSMDLTGRQKKIIEATAKKHLI